MAPSHILLLGPSGSGKTEFTNAVTGSNFAIGSGLTAQTSKVQSSNFVRNPDYVIIDTPGFDDDAGDRSRGTAVQIPGGLTKLVIDWCKARDRNSGQLRAIIYFHDLSRSRFEPYDLLNIKIMKKIVERTQVDVNAIFVVTTKGDGDSITQSRREERERELHEKIKEHIGLELTIIPCRRGEGHAIEVVQHIVDSLSPPSSNSAAPTSHLALSIPVFSPSVSTLVTNTERDETTTSKIPPSKQKAGLPRRIWRGIMKVLRRQTGHNRR